MSITVEALESELGREGHELEEKYKVEDRVNIAGYKTFFNDTETGVKQLEEKRFKRKDREAIAEFGKSHDIESVTFTINKKAKFNYGLEKGKLRLREVKIDNLIIYVDGTEEVELHI